MLMEMLLVFCLLVLSFLKGQSYSFTLFFNTSTKTVNCCQRKWFPIHLIFKHLFEVCTLTLNCDQGMSIFIL